MLNNILLDEAFNIQWFNFDCYFKLRKTECTFKTNFNASLYPAFCQKTFAENTYTVLVYYRSFSDRADELVGAITINSRNMTQQ